MLKDYLASKNISVYRLSKDSGVPYTTVLELTKNKTNIYKANVSTVIALSNTLNVTIDNFIKICEEKRIAFQEFRSGVKHELKRKGDKAFLKELLVDDSIKHYFEYGWYEESLYLLAMLDYLKNYHDIESSDNYDEIRNYKLEETSYPRDVEMMDAINGNNNSKKEAIKSGIKEFLKYNIVEVNVRNAV